MSTFPVGYDVKTSALDGFKLAVAQHLSTSLGVDLEAAYAGIESGKAGKNVQGDFTVAVPRFRLKGNPSDFSRKVVDSFVPNEYLESAAASGPFVSFKADTKRLTREVLGQINEKTYLNEASIVDGMRKVALGLGEAKENRPSFQRDFYGSNSSGAGQKILIEFSSPNIAKPFHAGHLRSTIIGAFLANLYEANGWDVLRVNYLGDWGKQFGVLAVGFEKYGSEEELKKDPITHLYDVYVKINAEIEKDNAVDQRAREFFVRMEQGDAEAVGLWKKFRDLSIVAYEDMYARLNVFFDVYSGESQVSHASQEKAINALLGSKILKTSPDDQSLAVDLSAYKLGSTVIRKKDGTYVYITRDIAGAAERYDKYHFDKMIYVVASQQDLHLAQFFKVLELMDYPWAKSLLHINFGMVQGMSTRKGTAVFLEQILNESQNVMHDEMKANEDKYKNIEDPETTSDKLGISAVKIQDMSAKRINNYEFQWSRMTSFTGDTGPYLQYAHVRLSSVERHNAHITLPPPAQRSAKINTDLLSEDRAREIVLILATFPDVVKAAIVNHEPSTICTFAFRLAHAISSAWETLFVRNQPEDVALARLWLFVCARDVLANAMKLLTLEPLERM